MNWRMSNLGLKMLFCFFPRIFSFKRVFKECRLWKKRGLNWPKKMGAPKCPLAVNYLKFCESDDDNDQGHHIVIEMINKATHKVASLEHKGIHLPVPTERREKKFSENSLQAHTHKPKAAAWKIQAEHLPQPQTRQAQADWHGNNVARWTPCRHTHRRPNPNMQLTLRSEQVLMKKEKKMWIEDERRDRRRRSSPLDKRLLKFSKRMAKVCCSSLSKVQKVIYCTRTPIPTQARAHPEKIWGNSLTWRHTLFTCARSPKLTDIFHKPKSSTHLALDRNADGRDSARPGLILKFSVISAPASTGN